MRSLIVVALLLSASCSSTGATLRSGVGDALLQEPPYYAGAPVVAVRADSTRIGHLPITYQRGAAGSPIFDPVSGPGTPVGDLLADMNAYLDSLATRSGVSNRVVEGGKVSSVSHAETTAPPDVRFGCASRMGVPGDDCEDRSGRTLGHRRQPLQLTVGRPSAEWTTWAGDIMRDVGVGRLLVITLEVSQYLPRQASMLGNKEVALGTRHVERLPWLTSLETPVVVLQLTGALVGADGRAIRIGAEGFEARRTRLIVSAMGAQELLRDEDVAKARTLRREDLPGSPIAWQVALQHLVAQLTGRAELAP